MTSIAIGGYGFGAMIWIPLQTAFVNPHNIQAKPENASDPNSNMYFVDPKLLNRVPDLFLLLGGIFAAFQIIGLLLMRPAKNNTYLVDETVSLSTTTEEEVKRRNSKDLTIKQTITSWPFWMLWTFMAFIQLSASFVYTYQKGRFINHMVKLMFIVVKL